MRTAGLKLWMILLVVLLMGVASNPGWAHNFTISDLEIDGFYHVNLGEHVEADPWKGVLGLTVTNTGTEAWGDFHFGIFQVGNYSIDNVFFDVSPPNQPTSTQAGLTWTVTNFDHNLNLFFNSDPILPGDTATFNVFTDNTTDMVNAFGVYVYPSPVDTNTVPLPSAIFLLVSGIMGLISYRHKY
ncbi:MAG: hypothetical protein KJ737_22710 [Proteobacteria bacterium]|nr:hypothetical protein [Pseudomonadota bacterium]